MLVKSLYFNLFVFALKTVGLVQPSFSWSCFFLSRPSLSLSLPFSLFLSSFLALYSLSHRLSHSQQPRKKSLQRTHLLSLCLSLSSVHTHTHYVFLSLTLSLYLSHTRHGTRITLRKGAVSSRKLGRFQASEPLNLHYKNAPD